MTNLNEVTYGNFCNKGYYDLRKGGVLLVTGLRKANTTYVLAEHRSAANLQELCIMKTQLRMIIVIREL